MLCRFHGNGQLAHGRHLLHLPWAEVPRGRRPCVTVEGTERTRWRQQPAARRCSWWLRVPSPATRAAHRIVLAPSAPSLGPVLIPEAGVACVRKELCAMPTS